MSQKSSVPMPLDGCVVSYCLKLARFVHRCNALHEDSNANQEKSPSKGRCEGKKNRPIADASAKAPTHSFLHIPAVGPSCVCVCGCVANAISKGNNQAAMVVVLGNKKVQRSP
eukprot:6463382-Amphidinium_carterae.1